MHVCTYVRTYVCMLVGWLVGWLVDLEPYLELDLIGEQMKTEGSGEVLYIHCDMRKEEDIKVYLNTL